jgi:hypothetical protein
MLPVDLGGSSQQIGYQTVWEVLRPTYRFHRTGPVLLDQAVDDLLSRRRVRWRRPLQGVNIEHMFEYTHGITRQR